MAGLKYRVAGSHVYSYPRDTGITSDDILSPTALFYMLFLYSWFGHIYYSAILLMPESHKLRKVNDKLRKLQNILGPVQLPELLALPEGYC